MCFNDQKFLTQVIDFVTPSFEEAGISVVMKKPVRDGNLFKFGGVMSSGLWAALGAVVAATAVILFIFERIQRNCLVDEKSTTLREVFFSTNNTYYGKVTWGNGSCFLGFNFSPK